MSKVLKVVGAHIRTIRNAKKLSQEQVAERADLHYTMVGAVERGERNVTLENLAKLAKGLGVPLREMFPIESQNDQSTAELVALLAIVDQHTSNLILSMAKLLQERYAGKTS